MHRKTRRFLSCVSQFQVLALNVLIRHILCDCTIANVVFAYHYIYSYCYHTYISRLSMSVITLQKVAHPFLELNSNLANKRTPWTNRTTHFVPATGGKIERDTKKLVPPTRVRPRALLFVLYCIVKSILTGFWYQSSMERVIQIGTRICWAYTAFW